MVVIISLSAPHCWAEQRDSVSYHNRSMLFGELPLSSFETIFSVLPFRKPFWIFFSLLQLLYYNISKVQLTVDQFFDCNTVLDKHPNRWSNFVYASGVFHLPPHIPRRTANMWYYPKRTDWKAFRGERDSQAREFRERFIRTRSETPRTLVL